MPLFTPAAFVRRVRQIFQTQPAAMKSRRRKPGKTEQLEARALLSATSFETQQLFDGLATNGDIAGFSVDIDADTAIVGAYRDDPVVGTSAVTDAGSASIFSMQPDGQWARTALLVASDAEEGELFGISVSIDGNTAVVGASFENSLGLDENGAAYVFTRDAQGDWNQTAKLTAPDAANGDRFGTSVSVEGDTIIVGAPFEEDPGFSASGSAYVFNRTGNTWAAGEKLTAASPSSNDQFGFSVDVSGDTIAVGAFADNVGSNSDQGSAHVFTRDAAGTWSAPEQLLASDGAAFDRYGRSVRVDGDTLVVGSLFSDSGGLSNSGGAYVYVNDSGAWTEQAKLIASDFAAGDSFGYSVDITGDAILVGARYRDSAGFTDSGAAYLFHRDGSTWNEVSQFVSSAPSTDDWLGAAVALSDNFAIAGAHQADSGTSTESGEAFLYRLNEDLGDAPAPYPTSRTDNGPVHGILEGFHLGTSVDMDATGKASSEAKGDDNDGNNDDDGVTFGELKVGDSAATANVFVTKTSPSIAQSYLNAWIDFNADGDWDDAGEHVFFDSVEPGNNTITFAIPADAAVGATFARFRLTDETEDVTPRGPAMSGEVEDYRVDINFDVDDPEQVAYLLASDSSVGDQFGISVAIDGDFALVGSLNSETGGQLNTGAAYVYEKNGGFGWSQVARLEAPNPTGGDQFGLTVDLHDGVAVVGARKYDVGGANDIGAVFVYELDANGAWPLTETLLAPGGVAGDQFGQQVSINGDTIITSSVFEDFGGNTDNGVAYIFERDEQDNWTYTSTLRSSSPDSHDRFGIDVAVDGDTAIVGAYFEDSATRTDDGAAYVFVRDSYGVWSEQARLVAPNGESNETFGQSVEVHGDRAIIGAYTEDHNGLTDNGAAYIFDRSSDSTWSSGVTLRGSDPENFDQFGYSVSIEGSTAVVGAQRADTAGFGESGAAYVFTYNESTDTWDEVDKLETTPTGVWFGFGRSVDLDGKNVVVGAYAADRDGLTDTGHAVIVDLNPNDTNFGDAPAPYPTLLANDGAVHSIVDGFHLGSVALSSDDGQPTLEARGVNWQGELDDDGVTFGQLKVGDASASVEVMVTNTAGVANPYLDAWIDFNADGDWDDAGEQIYSAAIAAGTNTILFAVPEDAEVGQTFARFRLHDGTTGLLPTGSAEFGEVEDYRVGISFDVNDPEQVAKLLASDSRNFSGLGAAVSVHGDSAIVAAAPWQAGGNTSTGSAYVYARDSNGLWYEQAKLLPSNGHSHDRFGSSVSIYGDTVIVGASVGHSSGVLNSGTAYVFTNDGSGTWSEQAILEASDAAVGDYFGSSVSVNLDSVVVGAEFEDSASNTNNGAAYVFVRDGSGGWSQQAKLLASNLRSHDFFGEAVDLDGDTVVIGASTDGDHGPNINGAVYVFMRDVLGGWSEQTILEASDAASGDVFGVSVGISGGTVVVGSKAENTSGSLTEGAAYVYARAASGTWSEQAKLISSDVEVGDYFGHSVDVSGDTIIVGALGEDSNGLSSNGAAYVFQRSSTGSWGETGKLLASDADIGDQFGAAVSLDGVNALVGARVKDSQGSTNNGTAYVVQLRTLNEDLGDAPTPYPTLLADDGPVHTEVPGFSLGTSWDTENEGQPSLEANGDDIDGSDDDDGVTFGQLKIGDTAATIDVTVTNTATVANPYLDAWIDFNADGDWDDAGEQIHSAAIASGTSTLTFAVPIDAEIGQTFGRFRLHDGTVGLAPTGSAASGEVEDYRVNLEFDAADPEQVAKLLASDADGGDGLGYHVSVDGDTAIVTALFEDINGQSDAGAAYVYVRDAQGVWSEQAKLTAPSPATADGFGYNVSLDGDTAIIGARTVDSGGLTNNGAAYIFERDDSNTWILEDTLTASDAASDDLFGKAVAVQGDTALVGAYFHDEGATSNSGAVYVFRRDAAGSWNESSKLLASDRTDGDLFGGWISLDGDTAIIGATNADIAGFDRAGAFYAFERDAFGAWSEQGKYSASSPIATGYFGAAHSLSGDTLVVGSYGATINGNTNSGTAYVFTRDSSGAWTEEVQLLPDDSDVHSFFGYSVDIEGGVIAVGAYLNNANGVFDTGASYIFERDNAGTWQQTHKLTADDASAGDYLGVSLDLDGRTLFVGAYGEDSGGNTGNGAAYVFGLNDDPSTTSMTFVTQLRDATDSPVSGNLSFEYRLFDAPTGGTEIWSAVSPNAAVGSSAGGYYQQDLLDLLPFEGAAAAGTYLEVVIDGTVADNRIPLDGTVVTATAGPVVLRNAMLSSATRDANDASWSIRLLGNVRQQDGSPLLGNVGWQADVYDNATGGTQLYSEAGVFDSNDSIGGAFGLALGENAPFDLTLLTNQSDLWVELSVNGETLPQRVKIDSGSISVDTPTYRTSTLQASRSFDIDSNTVYPDDTLNLWGCLQDTQTDQPVYGSRTIGVTLFTEAVSGVNIHSETASINVDDATYGSFVFPLGAAQPFDFDLLKSNPDIWVEYSVDGQTAAGDRTKLTTAPSFDSVRFMAARDYGDAPAPYSTLLADDGPVHTEVPGFSLGNSWDSENEGQPSLEANGDDADGFDDEDGVTFGQLRIGDTSSTADVTVTNTAGVANPFLGVWIDFNADGDWEDAGEQIYSAAITAGTSTLTFAVPEDSSIGQTFARFRLHDGTTALLPTGPAESGEVEDYPVTLVGLPPVASNDGYTTNEDTLLQPAVGLLANDADDLNREITLTAVNGQPLNTGDGSEIASATPNPDKPVFTTSLNADNYYGFRFELTEATTIDRVGGNFQFFTGTGPFAAIVALDSATDVPDSEDLSTPDVIANAVIPLAFQDDGEKSVEINAELQPGWYTVMFGTEKFGSTGITNLFLNSDPVPGTTFIHSQPGVPRFLTPTPASRIPDARLFVTTASGSSTLTDFALPSGAQLTVDSDGQFTYDPTTAFNSLAEGVVASDTFVYTIQNADGFEAEATATIDITGVNDLPLVLPRTIVISQQNLSGPNASNGLLKDATDPDLGDTLSVTRINGAALVSGEQILLPSGATIAVNSDGSLLYNPIEAFDSLTDGETGADSLTFTVSDNNGGTVQQTLSFTVNGFNDAPTISAVTDPIIIDEGETAALSGIVGDSEPGDLTLDATVGTVELQADGETFTWQYSATDDASTETVVITVTDADGKSSELLFDLTVNNVAPTLVLDASLSTPQLAPLTLSIDDVIDPGEDNVTSATINWGDGTSSTVTSLSDISHTYFAAPGTYQLSVTLEDEDGTYVDVASTDVIVTNVAPVLQSVTISETSIDEGQTITLEVSWTDGEEAHVLDIDWGDGNTSNIFVETNTSSESITYTYADDTPFGTSQDDFEVVVTIRDAELEDSTVAVDSVNRSFNGLRQIGSTGSSSVVGIQTDGNGNQYVAGNFSGDLWQDGQLIASAGAANNDWYVSKYDGMGTRLWTRTIGRVSFSDTLEAFSVSQTGAIVLAGGVTSTTDLDPGSGVVLPDGGDNVIVRLNSSGEFVSASTLPGSLRFANADLDDDGTLAVVGQFFGSIDFDPGSQETTLEATSNFSGFVAVYSHTGDLSWARGLTGTGFGDATGVSIRPGDVTVTGFFNGAVTIDDTDSSTEITSNGSFDLYAARFSSSGDYRWHAALGGSGDDRSYDFDVLTDGGVVVATAARGLIDVDPSETVQNVNLGSSSRPVLWALENDGTLAWYDDVSTAGNSRFTTVAVSPNDQRIVAGGTFDSVIFNDDGTNIQQPSLGSFLTVYDSSGSQEYLTNLVGPAFEETSALATTSDGRVLLGGTFADTIADAELTESLDTIDGTDAFVAEYTLTAAAPLHPQITVRNTAPVITDFTVVGDPNDPSRVLLSASYSDAGDEERFGIELTWGDDDGEAYWLEPGQTSLELSHLYVSNENSPEDGIYEITLGVIDDDFSFDVRTTQIAVNASPEATFETFALEFDEAAGTVQIPVSLSVAASTDITIPVITGGTAIEGTDPQFADYSVSNPEVFIASGQTTGFLTLNLLDDNLDEQQLETIELTLLENELVTLGRTPIMSVTITDNDIPTLSVPNPEFNVAWEDAGAFVLTAQLSGPRVVDTEVILDVAGRATTDDFELNSPQLTTNAVGQPVLVIPAGDTSVTMTIDILDDATNEDFYEDIRILASTDDPDVLISDVNAMTYYIRDNDPLVTIGDSSKAVDFRTVSEGNSLDVDVQLSAPTNVDTVIPLTSYGYWRRRASSNEFSVPSSITIPAGSVKATLTVGTAEDNLDESSERFLIATKTGAGSQGNVVYVQINDDDTAVASVSAQSRVSEGSNFPVTVSLSKPSVNDVLVKIRFEGSAQHDIVEVTNVGLTGVKVTRWDFGIPASVRRKEGREAWVNIPAGSKSATFTVGVNKDNRSENAEQILMKIVGVSGGAARGSGDTVTIRKNSAAGILVKDVSRTPVSYSEGSLSISVPESALNVDPAVLQNAANLLVTSPDGDITNAPLELSLPLGQAGALNGSTLFFDANLNGIADFLDLDGDGVFSTVDLLEPQSTTVLDGSASFSIPVDFDVNGDGILDGSEGQLAVVGGFDTSVDRPFEQTLTAPLGYRIVSPISTVVSELMKRRSFEINQATQVVQDSLNISGFNFASREFLYAAARGDLLAAETYRADVHLVTTARLVSAVFENRTSAPVSEISRLVYANLADKLGGASLDFSSTALMNSIVQGVAFELGVALPDSVALAAGDILASFQKQVSDVDNDASRKFVDQLARLHKTAEQQLVPVLRSLTIDTNLSQIVADNSGQALADAVAATSVVNVLAPELYVADVAVQESDFGTTVAVLQVGLIGRTDVPVSVDYGTLEGTATVADSDFVPVGGVLNWEPGDDEIQTIEVEINGDDRFEADEFFDVLFSNPNGLVMRHDFGRIFILNDDALSFTAEPTAGATNIRVVVNDDQLEIFQDDVLSLSEQISGNGGITINSSGDTAAEFELEVLAAGPILTNGIRFVGSESGDDALFVSSTLNESFELTNFDSTGGQLTFDSGIVEFVGVESVVDSQSARVDISKNGEEGSSVVLSAVNDVFPIEENDLLLWTVTGPNDFVASGSGNDLTLPVGDNGQYSVALELQRVGRGTFVTSQSFSVSNLNPTANDDGIDVSEDANDVVLNVASNDSDPAGAADLLTVTAIDTAATSGTATLLDGVLTYQPNASANALGVGEIATDSVGYTISDGDGGTAAAVALITIIGANDVPVVGGPLTAFAPEEDSAITVDLLNGASDVDTTDVLTVNGLTLTSGDDRGVSIAGNSLTINPSAYNELAVGESAVIEYSYNVIDGNGGGVPQTATITITGVNDVPTVSDAVEASASEDDDIFTLDLLADASDIDASDVLNVDGLTLTSGDDTGVSTAGHVLTINPAAYDELAVGESAVIEYSYNVTDGNGGSVPQTATIIITGVNDVPVVSSGLTVSATEDDVDFALDLLEGASDIDLSDTLSVDNVAFVNGDSSGLTIDGNQLLIDPLAYESLSVGQTEAIEVTFTINDGNGGSVAQTASVEITGANDEISSFTVVSSNESAESASVDGFVQLTGSITDIDSADQLTLTIDWGDGSVTESITVSRPADIFTIDHQYAAGGFYEVMVTANDGNGSTITRTVSAVVQGLGLVGDSLMFVGTNDRDILNLDEAWIYDGSGSRWRWSNWERRIVAVGRTDGDWFYRTFDPDVVNSIQVETLGGRDHIFASGDLNKPLDIASGDGDDEIFLYSGTATVHAGSGDDIVVTADGNDIVEGGAGDDCIHTGDGDDTVTDTSGNNQIHTGVGNDTVMTGGGDDQIWTDDGHDRVHSGAGNDIVELGRGNDVAILGAGDDVAHGGRGDDALIGNDGDDRLFGQKGDDLLIGGRGADVLAGGKGDDLLIAGRTTFENDATSIDQIMAVWGNDASLADRISDLRNGTGLYSNGVPLVAGSSLFADDERDVLKGNKGRNWYIADTDHDQVKHVDDNDVVDWIDSLSL